MEGEHFWSLPKAARLDMWNEWVANIQRERAEIVATLIERSVDLDRELRGLQLQKDLEKVKLGRVIGCTTTGAAMHHEVIREAKCEVVLIEEAAEVLEAHVLTAVRDSTKHLIMIGDHKQLRPKVEQYELRIESGRGLDLNVSLFERLIQRGYPHTTLELQHRMPPEVSKLVKDLTYPQLRDGPSTSNRPQLKGIRDRVCFVAHNEAEEGRETLRQRQDHDGTTSKINLHEVQMIQRTVRHLLLQGYRPDQVTLYT
ncbi:unnamed protein product [Choristocarpus tenellus]